MVFECEGSSVRARARARVVERSSARARARVVERSSARGRGLYRARRRRAESGSLLESHVAPIIIQRNYRYKLANMLYACYSSSNC